MKLVMMGSGSYKSSLTFRLVALGEWLAKSGFQVSLIVPSADKYNNFTPDKSASLNGIQLKQPWQFTTRNALINLVPYLISSLVALLRSHADVIYIYKPTPITVLGLIPKLLFGKPVILDLDDLGSEVMRLQHQSGFQVRLVALCERLVLRHANAVVVSSTYLQAYVKERHPHKQILLLSNGVNPDDYSVPIRKPRHAIYYFGALNRLSLIESTLRALPAVLQRVPTTTITIFGGGSALDDAKALTESLGIASAVMFTGWIDMFAVQKQVHYADIALCFQPDTPTVRAASNMKVFQYMAMSSVPVVSDVGDLKLYTQNGTAGIAVDPTSVTQLSDTLIELLEQDGHRVELATQARQLAKTTYSWQHLAQQLQVFITAVTLGNTEK